MGHGLFPKIYFLAQSKSARFVMRAFMRPITILPILWL